MLQLSLQVRTKNFSYLAINKLMLFILESNAKVPTVFGILQCGFCFSFFLNL